MTALVWKGMFNQQFGVINRWLGTSLPWLDGDWLPYFSILLVNTWLGYPYMFLVCSGAAAEHPDGPQRGRIGRRCARHQAVPTITFPLLLVAVAPLLVASFAFNFNNFNLIYLLTEGRPPVQGSDAGRTDILISFVYKLAFAGGRGVDYGFASALSLVIFIIVARHLRVQLPLHQVVRGPTMTTPVIPRRPRRPFQVWFRQTGWRHLVAWAALVFALFPVLWVISAALTDGNLSSQSLIPDAVTLDNFRALMTEDGHPPFWRWFFNSIFIGVVTSVSTVFLCALAAFAFSRLRFRGRRPGMLALLLIQMFPNLLAVVAIFLFMTRIKGLFPAVGLGTSWGLIFVYLGGALGVNTYLIKGFFDTIPHSLDEAAKIDGCTHAQTFFKIILPLATPVLAVIALLSFITTQAEFLVASVLLGQNDDAKTLAVGLSQYILAGFDNRWGPFAAGSLIGAIPVVLLFMFLQRFIVSGLTSGAVKE